MNTSEVSFPKRIAWTVVALSVMPILLSYLLVWIGFPIEYDPSPIGLLNVPGALVHAILEATSICIALCTVAFAFSHFSVTRDMIMPAIGTALFFSAMIDFFQILAALGLTMMVRDRVDFIGITWAMSRTFYICLLIGGTVPFTKRPQPTGARRISGKGMRYIVLSGILFVAMAYAIILILASSQDLLDIFWEDSPIPRPWDLLPLILFLVAGGVVFPRFDKMNPSLFSKGLIVSVVPNVAAQLHMAYGSKQLYDADFNIALFLKIVAYLVPLVGLILDYTRAYRVEVTLRTTEEKLRVARRVQQGLLPKSSPEVASYDISGRSYPADVVGGDYFDFIPMQNGGWGIVVADVSGHEIGASILMAQTRAYLRALSLEHGELSPMITQVNRFLNKDVQDRWFVTLFFVALDPKRHSFRYAAAGHECYLLTAKGETKTLESLSPPLGVLEDGEIACGPETSLAEGDLLLLMTDGMVEATSPDGEQFGLKRVLAVVEENRDRDADVIVDALYKAAEKYRGAFPRTDDVTVVILKRTGRPN